MGWAIAILAAVSLSKAYAEAPNLESLQKRLMERNNQTLDQEPAPAAVVTPLWLPMCFFLDPAVDPASANERIQSLVSAYASCSISLEPYTFTLKPEYPQDYQSLVVAARAACPLDSHFKGHGAIQIITPHPVAAQMCHDSKAQGCSTLCEPTSVSFINADASSMTFLHESMHANCCGPACVEEGLGIGVPVGPHLQLASGIGRPLVAALEKTIHPEGCEALRKGAHSSDVSHWYGPGRTEFYTRTLDPLAQVDLLKPRNLLISETPAPADEKKTAATPPALGGVRAILRSAASQAVSKPKQRPLLPMGSATPKDVQDLRQNERLISGSNRQTTLAPEEKPAPPLKRGVTQTEPSGTRNRGAGLRKAGDAKRQHTSSGVTEINSYQSE